MAKFLTFRHKSSGVLADYPEHYATHPIFGADLEVYVPEEDEYEEEKVVAPTHELPVEQRVTVVAKPKNDNKSEDK